MSGLTGSSGRTGGKRVGVRGEQAATRAAGAAGVGTRGAGLGPAGRAAWAYGARCVGARGARRGRACARKLGMLAGSAGPSWCTVHLAQF